MSDVIDIVGISGGKDSTATALFYIESMQEKPRFVFCDTGIESPATYEYVAYLDEVFKSLTGCGIEMIKADFSEQMAKKKDKLLANGEDRRANVMEPTGNPFLDLCVWKGRFPSTKARFCTQELKMNPLRKYFQALIDSGDTVMSWSGERAEESLARSKKPVRELLIRGATANAYVYRPILRWKESDCFEMLKRHNVKPNPLYEQGFNRVGCFPCIMCRKAEIKLINENYPEVFEKLAEWEKRVSLAAKRESGSFFFAFEGNRITLADHIEWSYTSRGGKQYQLELSE